MASPNDVAMEDRTPRDNEPFTIEENIHQLNAIDKSMVQLMNHTATALNALTTPAPSSDAHSSSEGPGPSVDPAAQKEAFRLATDTFLSTLHSIDIRMKRQILALEEAGIVNLTNSSRQDPKGPTKAASLKPNGVGAVGNLDVGWLNSRSTKVERDMELELWDRAKELLEKELESVNKG